MNIDYQNQSEIVSNAYVMYADQVKALFLQYNISNEDADDLLQELFIKILGVETLRSDTIKSLIMVAAYNMRKDYFRKKTFRNNALANMKARCDLYISSSYDESAIIANDIKHLEMRVVANTLNTINCKVYSMSRFEEKTSAEIADEMGLDLHCVESRLYYSRKLVRRKMACAL